MKVFVLICFILACIGFIVYNVICIVKKVRENKKKDQLAYEKVKKENQNQTTRKD